MVIPYDFARHPMAETQADAEEIERGQIQGLIDDLGMSQQEAEACRAQHHSLVSGPCESPKCPQARS